MQARRAVCVERLGGRVLALQSAVVVECVVAAKTNDEVGKTDG